MKKRILALITAAAVCCTLVGCDSQNSDTSSGQSESSSSDTTESTSSADVSTPEPDDDDEDEEPAEPEVPTGFNMIDNPDFSGANTWMTYTTSGGTCEMDVKDGQLSVDIAKIGAEEHSVQIYYDGFKLVQGCKYEIKFDASSTIERKVQYRIQINGGDYHPYSAEYITLTPDTKRYEIAFTMEEATDPAPRLCFNMGLIDGAALDAHTTAFDNFELFCVDDSGRMDGSAKPVVPKILLNQIGYRPGDSKTAVFVGKNAPGAFNVVDVKSGSVVFSGTVGAVSKNPDTNRREARVDFSGLNTPGRYKLTSETCGESYEFIVGDDVYKDAFAAALKMFCLQRCGVELGTALAGDFAHPVCHSAKAVIYGTDTKIDVSGGWHDAGDYGRYVVSGAKAAADLLLAYEDHPDVFDDALGIPESGNGVPDVLDEVRFELDWMFKMQASDGGVYHKVTCRNFPGTVMPQSETEELVVTPVSNTATGDFAAVMAMAARIYADIDAAFANKCKDAAIKAWGYLETHGPDGGFKNPSDVVTGEYPDAVDTDERLWAAAELFRTTGDAKYGDAAKKLLDDKMTGLGWADVACYGAYAYSKASGADSGALSTAKAILNTNAETARANADSDSYRSSISAEYPWGSNMTIANNGMLFYMTGMDSYGKAQLDYLFGTNGNAYCFLSGFGTLSPVHSHHRPSQYLGKEMPGMLAGGPDSNLEDPYAKAVLSDTAPALCYVDNDQSYSCNEITVYWNSPLIYLMAAVMGR